MKKLTFLFLLSPIFGFAQSSDEYQLSAIYKSALTNSKCYSWLDYLSNDIGHRLSGSEGAQKAVEYTKAQMEASGAFDKVYLQEVMVPKWVRGEKETGMTIHFVDEEVDRGKIILQKTCPVLPGDTPEKLKERVQELEKEWYPQVIQWIVEGKVK